MSETRLDRCKQFACSIPLSLFHAFSARLRPIRSARQSALYGVVFIFRKPSLLRPPHVTDLIDKKVHRNAAFSGDEERKLTPSYRVRMRFNATVFVPRSYRYTPS